MNFKTNTICLVSIALLSAAASAWAGEDVLGYVKGAEVLPKGEWELKEGITWRTDKGEGDYDALNFKTEVEYGFTNRLSGDFAFKLQSINTNGLVIDGYLPKDESYGATPSGIEGALKYNFLSPAKDDFGLSGYWAFNYDWLDPHSGQDKNTYSLESALLLQKYFLEGQLIWMGNIGFEATYAVRASIDDLPEGFDWPTNPEMEIEPQFGMGLSYRFAPDWFIGGEALYETEFETEVGQERWSGFAGPSLHYAGNNWWTTLTWLFQVAGGGEEYPGQADKDLHLIEKTKQEVRLKVGFEF